MTIREEIVRANGLSFRCLTAGEGPLLLLLHGFPQSSHAWRKQIPALAERFRVVAPDMRGYGGTDAPPRVSDYRIEALTADIAGLIEALGEKRARIVGHDWGGAVAWATAHDRPELVERLAVINCPHPKAMMKALVSNPRQLARSWYILFFQLPWLPERVFRRDDGAIFEKIFLNPALRPGAFTKEDAHAYRDALLKPGALTGALNYYRAALRHPRAWDRKISAPTLLIWGERDDALGVELTQNMEALFSGRFELRRVPDATHWVNEEQPELVNLLLLDFSSSGSPIVSPMSPD